MELKKLDENGPFKCLGLSSWSPVSGTLRISRYIAFFGGVPLCFEVSKAQGRPGVSLCMLPADQDVKLSYSATAIVCFPAMMTMDSETVSQPLIKCILL